MAQTVIGFFDNSSNAQDAVEKLVDCGISTNRIDVSGSNSSSETKVETRNDDDDDNGITRFFKNLFGDDDDNVNKYSGVASRSQRIITVHANTNDEAERAADILDDCGAVNVDESAAKFGYSGSTDDKYGRNREEKLDVIEENLEVGKREVEKGAVRLRSRIIERPVEESIRLRKEHVTVERTPVNRDATSADFSNFEEKDIEMVERTEVPVVNKHARVVEEVRLNKEVEETSETIHDTVRKTEVDVENIDKDDLRNRNSRL
jgi:uncharacterized protein (TIGR02271 family)